MNKKKLIQMMLAVTLPGVATFGEISITDNLGVRGFVQGSYEKSDVAGADTESLDMNGVDVDFLFSSETVGSEVHLSSSGSTINLEQAFLTYDLGGGLNVTGGKYLSLLGYEGDEPYKLYQRSMAYVIGDDNKIPFAAYHQGVKAAFSSGDLSGAISVVDSVYNSDGNAAEVGFEAQIKYTGLENFTIAIGTAQENDTTTTVDEYYNLWVEYGGIDSLILGAEYNSYDYNGKDGDSWMLMGNYSVNEKVGLTLRYSQVEEDNLDYEADKFTISPSYSFSDSLLGRIEYSTGEVGDDDVDYFSIEALFTF
jgi:hypothetical protein